MVLQQVFIAISQLQGSLFVCVHLYMCIFCPSSQKYVSKWTVYIKLPLL